MTIESIFGFIAFFTSIIGLLPQIIKSVKTRSTKDISMGMLINYIICSVAWIVYGSYSDSSFVIYSNVLGLASSMALAVLKINYDKGREHAM